MEDHSQEKKFTRIEPKTDLYQQELNLRDEVLRKPLGLSIASIDQSEDQSQMHFGVLQRGQLIACVVMKPLTDNRIKLRQMAVSPPFQNKGIGRLLVEYVEKTVKKQGIKQIELNARMVALEFYRRCGYHTAGDEFSEVGIPHMKMTKEI